MRATLPWKHPSILAPLEGVSHPEFRHVMAERGGLGMVCTEFVRISRAPLSARALRREVIPSPPLPLCVQVMGNDAEKMAEAAGLVAEAGADVVDINMGCPAPRVVRQGVGAAMLRDPALLHAVVSAMRQRVPVLLSAKMRAGFDERDHVLRNAEIVAAAGVDYIAVHPRRRADFYEGVADWRIIRELVRNLDVPVVGNGDCWYAADALRMMEETGCAAVMIGRPALRNPWIFRQIQALREGREPEHPDGEDLLGWIHSITARYRGFWPEHERATLGKLKELITWLGRAVDDGGAWRRATLREESVDAILTRADRILAPLSPGDLDLDARGSLALERSGSVEEA